jgi:hypothetical protein
MLKRIVTSQSCQLYFGCKMGCWWFFDKKQTISRDESECFYPHVNFIARGLIEGQLSRKG